MKELKYIPDDPRQKFWVLWRHTGDLVSKYFDDTLTQEQGLSYQQFMVLLSMVLTGCKANATILSEQLDRNPNTLSTILDRMQENGLVQKVRDLPDRRQVRVAMTDQGRAQFNESIKVIWRTIQKLTSSFTEDELKTFAALIMKLEETTRGEMEKFKAPRGKRKRTSGG
jgi:DNA-binding MarR family transcriptional regulator